MTKEEIRDVIMQISNDCDKMEVAMSQLDMELVSSPSTKKLLQLHEDMELWLGTLETSIDDLKVEIEKLPNEEILNELEIEK